jgi:dTDP-4-amino-4,6-dideoxygalactose transaminase
MQSGPSKKRTDAAIPEGQSTDAMVAKALIDLAQSPAWRTYRGAFGDQLSSLICGTVGKSQVRLCASGTLGVELAIRSLNLRPGDEVLLATYDFPGNFRAIEDAGGTIALCDVQLDDWTLDFDQLEQTVHSQTKAIVVSHLHGSACDMGRLRRFADERSIALIEDACQAHGATISGKPAGSWGDLSVFSFGGSKLIASGRGGAVLTSDPVLAQRMTVYCERGNDAFALSELQAALLIPQWEQLPIDHARRAVAAKRFFDGLAEFTWVRPVDRDSTHDPAYYKVGLRLIRQLVSYPRFVGLTMSEIRDQLLGQLQQHEVLAGPGFRGFAKRSARRCRPAGRLSGCERAVEETVLVHHQHLLNLATNTSAVETVLNAFQRVDRWLNLT